MVPTIIKAFTSIKAWAAGYSTLDLSNTRRYRLSKNTKNISLVSPPVSTAISHVELDIVWIFVKKHTTLFSIKLDDIIIDMTPIK